MQQRAWRSPVSVCWMTARFWLSRPRPRLFFRMSWNCWRTARFVEATAFFGSPRMTTHARRWRPRPRTFPDGWAAGSLVKKWRRWEPALAGGQVHGAFLQEDAYLVDTDGYLNGLLTQCAQLGVDIRLADPVLEVRETGSEVEVKTGRGSIATEKLVVAAGAWSGSLPGLPPLPVKPMRDRC